MQIADKDELDEFVKRQGNMGFYPAVMPEFGVPAPEGGSGGAAGALFKQLVLERVREWASSPLKS